METSFALLVGAIAGAIGGWLTGGMLKDLNLGNTVNTIIGLLGGIIVGYSLHAVFPGSDGNVSLTALLGQGVGALASGGILVAICALVKDLLSPKSSS